MYEKFYDELECFIKESNEDIPNNPVPRRIVFEHQDAFYQSYSYENAVHDTNEYHCNFDELENILSEYEELLSKFYSLMKASVIDLSSIMFSDMIYITARAGNCTLLGGISTMITSVTSDKINPMLDIRKPPDKCINQDEVILSRSNIIHTSKLYGVSPKYCDMSKSSLIDHVVPPDNFRLFFFQQFI